METTSLHMIALMPPADIAGNIRQIQQDFAHAYNCQAALKPPVHITLYPPFKLTGVAETEMATVLRKWAAARIPFEIRLRDFGAFERNGVIYIRVERNETLGKLHKEMVTVVNRIREATEIEKPKDFHPHITVGYRDIPKELFPGAMKDFLPRKFSSIFRADRIYFWKHNGRHWEARDPYHFRPDDSVRQPALF